MSQFTFEIFSAAIISTAIIAYLGRAFLKTIGVRLMQIEKRLEATELHMMKLDQALDKWGAHFDKRCDDMEYDLKEINRQISDVNLRFVVLETRAQERAKSLFPEQIAKRPYRRRQPKIEGE